MAKRWNPAFARWEEPLSLPAPSPAPAPAPQMADVPIVSVMPGLQPQYYADVVREPYAGAFQRVVTERRENLTANGAIYACLAMISGDVAKCPFRLMEESKPGIWKETRNPAYSPVLRKPNRYQTRLQFVQYWMLAKLLYGNEYVLLERDNRGGEGQGNVTAMYPLHPACARPLVTDEGEVWYEVRADNLAGIEQDRFFPARDVIHDRMNTLFHPLVGVSPLYAAALTVTQGNRIQNNSAKFFENMSRPSGILTVPGRVTPEQEKEMKAQFEAGFSRDSAGRTFVATGGMKYEPLTMPPEQAQLIEQLKWTDQNAILPFLMPPHKLGITNPTAGNTATYNMSYYQDCVQLHIDAMEALLDEALRLGPQFQNDYGVDMDTRNLLRMDPAAQMDVLTKGVSGMVMAVNEARGEWGLSPVVGGEEPLSQQQYWPLRTLKNRAPPTDAVVPNPPARARSDDDDEEIDEAEARAFIERIRMGLAEHAAQ